MAALVLRRNLSEPTFALAIALRGVPDVTTQEAVEAEVLWRWEDEPDMLPQSLGKVTAGNELAVPFDLQNRAIRVYSVAKTAKGDQDVIDVKSAEMKRFDPSLAPELSALVYDTTPNEVTGTIAGNGGIGTIRVFRKQGSGGSFAQIQTLAYTATSFVDEPPVNEDYFYKLTQDGQAGESVTRMIIADNAGGTTGTAPTSLNAVYNASPRQAELDWTNNGGTGDITVERKVGFGGTWYVIATLASSAVAYDDTSLDNFLNQMYYYRVSNASAIGFSNEADVYVPGLEF